MASGLIAYFAVIFYLQSRNQWYFAFAPYILFGDLCRCLLGKTEKAGRAAVFLYWHHQV